MDRSAAGEADFPGLLVTDTEGKEPGLAVLHYFQCFVDDSALDAAAGDGTDHIVLGIDNQLTADWPWRGAPGPYDRRNGDIAP